MSTSLFHQYFSHIDDPRQLGKIDHKLFDILFLTITAVIAGCQGWEDIEEFGEFRLDWLRQFGLFENGLPVHDTIARVISRIDPVQLQNAFIGWMQETANLSEHEVVAIDGKTLKRSYDRADKRSAIHMVSAFAAENGVVLGQLKTEAKSNEITAIPALLSLLEIKGCLITIDAMGCQKAIARQIKEKQADYLLAVKGNQKTLFEEVKRRALPGLCEQLRRGELKGSIEQGHGREEFRLYYTCAVPEEMAEATQWTGLKTLGVVASYRKPADEVTEKDMTFRFYISSAELDSAQFAHAVRAHWGIESVP